MRAMLSCVVLVVVATNMPWGLREMHVAEPDGDVIRLGHQAG